MPSDDQRQDISESAANAIVTREGDRAVVRLDPDHPGFRDGAYRARRNAIAQIALDYERGAVVPDAPYVAEEHAVWREIWRELGPAHAKHACAEYRKYASLLDLPRDRIPQLEETSRRIRALSGFRLEPVAGLINSRDFLAALSNGVFLATQYIRHHSTPLYTPEPDVCHELAGHAAQLASPLFAELNREVGRAALRTDTDEQLQRLANIYWFTIEFGVLREEGQVKAYGAGLLSSFGELEAMSDARIEEMANWELMETQLYDVTQYQPVLFCAPSFEAMVEQLTRRLQRWPNAAN
ncbi:MAG: phenylalanine 4-monooxygenase [Myxococcales bacterium]|nr:phenylalanine 4-monooxygenase [Myxococcales bacterium]